MRADEQTRYRQVAVGTERRQTVQGQAGKRRRHELPVRREGRAVPMPRAQYGDGPARRGAVVVELTDVGPHSERRSKSPSHDTKTG